MPACLDFMWLQYQTVLGLSVILPLLMATLPLTEIYCTQLLPIFCHSAEN